MKRVVLIFVLLASALIPALAQKIETETGDRTRIVHLKTALNHLTVIEVAEPVVQVAAGSPSFKVEWRPRSPPYENRVRWGICGSLASGAGPGLPLGCR